MSETIVTGNHGAKVRSDCQISLKLSMSGGIKLEVFSRVKTMYGRSIEKLLLKILEFYNIKHAHLRIDDSGALPFVIAARLEAAIRRILDSDKEFLLPMEEFNSSPAARERFRFSRLYLPGNNPSMMLNAGIHYPNGIILDLEDSVAHEKKWEARFLVRNALRTVNFYGAERMVRINQYPRGIKDLGFVVPHNVNVILLPKCEGPEQVLNIEKEIENLKSHHQLKSNVFIMPIIESALGIERSFEIACSSRQVIALAIGLEDYTADIGVQRTETATESFYARTRLVNACKAAGIQAIDSVFSDVSDENGLRETAKKSKSLGFDGMGCIHPRQISTIHEIFAPGKDEVEKAEKIVNAFLAAGEKGLGVVSLGSKMIDPPVVKRAQRIIDLAINLKMMDANWRNKYVDKTE